MALVVGGVAGFLTSQLYQIAPGGDFFQVWAAARVLRDGGNAYAMVGPGLTYPWDWPLYYPLPAFLAALPLAWLSPALAGALFFGAANTALAFAVMNDASHRSLIFFSGAWLEAALYCQWSPLLTAAFLLPSLGWVFAAKPNLGLALFAARPSRIATCGIVTIALLSLVADPTWPMKWLAAIRGAPHLRVPIASWPGVLLLLALSRWRRWDARLLVALACVPQTPHLADTLPLFLIPNGKGEMILLVAASYVEAWLVHRVGIPSAYGQYFAMAAPLITLLLYLPCLIMVLRRPNEGPVPAWLDRGAARAATTLSRFPLARRALAATKALMQYGSSKITLRRPRSGTP